METANNSLEKLLDAYKKERQRISLHLTFDYCLYVALTLIVIVCSIINLAIATQTKEKILSSVIIVSVTILAFAKPKEYWQANAWFRRRMDAAFTSVEILKNQGLPEKQIIEETRKTFEDILDEEAVEKKRLAQSLDR